MKLTQEETTQLREGLTVIRDIEWCKFYLPFLTYWSLDKVKTQILLHSFEEKQNLLEQIDKESYLHFRLSTIDEIELFITITLGLERLFFHVTNSSKELFPDVSKEISILIRERLILKGAFTFSLTQIMGVKEAGIKWGLSEGYIKNLCAEGKIKAVKIGKTWIIDRNQKNPSQVNIL